MTGTGQLGAVSAGTDGERKLAPDLARGTMLLLIAMAYAGVYAGAVFGSPVAPDLWAPDVTGRFLTAIFLDNRAFPMFAILFGYGIAWMIAGQRAKGMAEDEARRLLRRRSLLLLLFGVLHAFLVFPDEILASYGLAGLLLGWLVFRSDRAIRRAIGGLSVGYVLTVSAAMIGLMTDPAAAEPSDSGWVPGYASAQDWVARAGAVPISPLYITIAYPLLLMLVLGFAAARLGLLDQPARHRGLLARIAIGGIALSTLGALPTALTAVGLLQPEPFVAGTLLAVQVLTGVAGGAGYAAVFALLSLRLEQRPGAITRAVAAVGKRSLTFYLFNSVLLAVILHPDLLALGARVDSFGALTTAFAVWCVAVLIATWMEHTERPGPADLLLRRLVYRSPSRDRTKSSP